MFYFYGAKIIGQQNRQHTSARLYFYFNQIRANNAMPVPITVKVTFLHYSFSPDVFPES